MIRPSPGHQTRPALFKKVIHGSPLINVRNKLQILHMQDLLGWHPIHTLQDWLDVITQVFVQANKAVALKLPYAYNSSLAVSKLPIMMQKWCSTR
jgi:hypothetical protein